MASGGLPAGTAAISSLLNQPWPAVAAAAKAGTVAPPPSTSLSRARRVAVRQIQFMFLAPLTVRSARWHIRQSASATPVLSHGAMRTSPVDGFRSA